MKMPFFASKGDKWRTSPQFLEGRVKILFFCSEVEKKRCCLSTLKGRSDAHDSQLAFLT